QLPRFVLVATFDAATYKQPLMYRVQTRRMRRRTSGDGPLGDDGTLVQIDDLEVTFTSNGVAHGDVQPFARGFYRGASGFVTIHFYTADQFASFGVDELNRTVSVSRPCHDGGVI